MQGGAAERRFFIIQTVFLPAGGAAPLVPMAMHVSSLYCYHFPGGLVFDRIRSVSSAVRN